MTTKKRQVILIFSFVLFAVVAPLLLLYSTGYRWDSQKGSYKTGGVYVSSPVAGSKIYINNRLEKETSIFQNGVFVQNLKPKNYTLMVVKDNFWPWAKKIAVKEQMVTEARALLIPKEPTGETISLKDKTNLSEKYAQILATFTSTTTPTTNRTLRLGAQGSVREEVREEKISTTTDEINFKFTSNKKERIWTDENNTLWIEWLGEKDSLPYYFCDDTACESKIQILNSKYPITSFDFYPGRKDIAVVAIANNVYALEIDGRGGRLLQPIYKGKSPKFLVDKSDSAIYILEKEDEMLIKIILP